MTIDQALKLEEYCVTNNKNYQYQGESKANLLAMALKSFGRLTKELQEKITAHWLSRKLDVQDCIRLRFISQTNLFFLCRLLEKYKDVTDYEYLFEGKVHNTHEE